MLFRAAGGAIPRDFERAWGALELNQLLYQQRDIDLLQKEMAVQGAMDPAVLGKRLAENLEDAIRLLDAQLAELRREEARLKGWRELQNEVLRAKSTYATGRIMHLLEKERPNVAQPLRLTTPTAAPLAPAPRPGPYAPAPAVPSVLALRPAPPLSTAPAVDRTAHVSDRPGPEMSRSAARRIIASRDEMEARGGFRRLDMNDVHRLHDSGYDRERDFSYYVIEAHRLQEKIALLRQRQTELTVGVLTGRSCCFLKPLNPTRRRAAAVMSSPFFTGYMNLIIVASCACLVVDRPYLPAAQSASLQDANLFFNLCFVVEAGIKIVALGEQGYLRDAWNRLDLFIVLISGVDTVLSFLPGSNTAALGAFKTMRIFRAVRPLRIIFKSGSGGLQIILSAVGSSLQRIVLVVGLTWIALTVFALIGMELLSANLGVCSDVDVAFRGDCVGPDPFLSTEDGVTIPRNWTVRPRNFDWIGAAFVSVLSLATHDDLPSLYTDAVDSTGDDNYGPYEYGREWLAAYFVPLIIACALFFINLFIGVMANAYTLAADDFAARAADGAAGARRQRTLTRADLPPLMDEEEEEGEERSVRALRRNFRRARREAVRRDGCARLRGTRSRGAQIRVPGSLGAVSQARRNFRYSLCSHRRDSSDGLTMFHAPLRHMAMWDMVGIRRASAPRFRRHRQAPTVRSSTCRRLCEAGDPALHCRAGGIEQSFVDAAMKFAAEAKVEFRTSGLKLPYKNLRARQDFCLLVSHNGKIVAITLWILDGPNGFGNVRMRDHRSIFLISNSALLANHSMTMMMKLKKKRKVTK